MTFTIEQFMLVEMRELFENISLAVAVLFILALFLAILSQAYVSAQSVGWAVVLFGPILLLTVYIHELGHCWASLKVHTLQHQHSLLQPI